MHRLAVVVIAVAVLAVGTQAPAQSATGSPTASASAAKKPKCKKGHSAYKVRGKYRCLKRPRCTASQKIKLKGRKLVCVRRTPAPAPAPGPAPAPAPGPAPAPTPATADPRQRATELLRNKLFTRYSSTASQFGSGSSRDTRYALCGSGTFQYSYEFTSDASPDLYRRDTASGTWVVSQAEFNDAAGAMRAVVDYTVQQTNNPEIVSGQVLIEAQGDKAYIGGEEFGYAANPC